jgi:heme/copper-type cytochrome/quinol oxidase subunit 2
MKDTGSKHIAKRIVLLALLACLCVTVLKIRREQVSSKVSGELGTRAVENPLQIKARGFKRAWQFSYAGLDGMLGTPDDATSTGELSLPVDTEVILSLRSEDYIYVFSCPELKLKEIAVPELDFSITFKTERLGVFDLVMDAMCGFQLPPGQTMGTINVTSKAHFEHWLKERSETSPSIDHPSR